VEYATRDVFSHVPTTMYYDSEEHSSASNSDNEGELDNDDTDDENGDDDERSDAAFGENLRVRGQPFSLKLLISNDGDALRMTSRPLSKETLNSGEILPSAKPLRRHPSPVYTSRGSA